MRWSEGCSEGVHKFEARYNSEWPKDQCYPTANNVDVIGLIEAIKTQAYIHDICVRCGKIIKEAK